MNLVSSIASAVTPASPFSFPTSPDSDSAGTSFGASFGAALQGALSDVNAKQLHAGVLVKDFAAGKASDIHTVMIASEQASLALQLTTQVRNKVVEAYQEIMKISM